MIIQKITFLTLVLVVFSSSLLVPLPPTSKSVLSKSISEIIGNYYSKYTRNVDIIDFGGNQGDLVNEILLNLENSTAVTLIKTQSADNFTRKIEKQSILLFNNITDFLSFERSNFSYIRNTEGFSILVYCQNATVKDLRTFSQDTVLKPFFYFIILDENDNELKLWTFENRMYYGTQPELCLKNFDFVQVNKFSSVNMSWIEKPVFRRKFRNFYNCDMYFSYDDTVNCPNFCLEFSFLINVVAKHLNFSASTVSLVNMRKSPWMEENNFIKMKPFNKLEIDKDFIQRKMYIKTSCNVQLLVTPFYNYSLFEKISFEAESWIAILAAFSSILFIFVLLRLTAKSPHRKYQLFDIFRIVFGYKITKMSNISFLGLVFMIFVFGFMIIRTAYHGKMFEFSIIKQMPKSITLDELKARNYTIYIEEHIAQNLKLQYIDQMLGLPFKIVSYDEFKNIYTDYFTNSSFAGAIFLSDLIQLDIPETNPLTKPILFNAPKAEYISQLQNPFYWADRYQEIQDIFLTSGLDQSPDFKRGRQIIQKDSWQLEEHVLRLDQIGWKFLVPFLGFYLVCFLVLLIEVLVYRREEVKIMIFIKMEESDYSCIVKLSGWLKKWLTKAQKPSESDTRSLTIPSIVIEEYIDDTTLDEDLDIQSESESLDGILGEKIIDRSQELMSHEDLILKSLENIFRGVWN